MKDTLSNTEKKTAYILTLPAVALVFAIILFPIFANVWISFKEVELKDIRIPEPRAKKIVKSISDDPSKIKILYKLRNSSLLQEIRDVSFQDKFPKNFEIEELDTRCNYNKNTFSEPTNIAKEQIICKDGFCSLANQKESSKMDPLQDQEKWDFAIIYYTLARSEVSKKTQFWIPFWGPFGRQNRWNRGPDE